PNQHCSAPSFRASVLASNQVYSCERADAVSYSASRRLLFRDHATDRSCIPVWLDNWVTPYGVDHHWPWTVGSSCRCETPGSIHVDRVRARYAHIGAERIERR